MLEVYSLQYLRQQVNGHVRLMVEDEGKGFEPVEVDEPSAVGLVLPSVRERVELVGGRLRGIVGCCTLPPKRHVAAQTVAGH